MLFVVGSTGGHIYPALAVAYELRKSFPKVEISFLGPLKELAQEIISKEGYHYLGIDTLSWKQKISLLYLIKFFYQNFKSFIESFKYLLRHKPKIVVGFGSYTCGPALMAAYFLGIPIIIHEQNLKLGMTNKILAYLAKKVCLAYPSNSRLPKKKVVVTGNPIRSNLLFSREKEQVLEKLKSFNLKEGKFTILVFGGSQGSKAINEVVVQVLLSSEFNNYPFQMILVTGINNFEQIKKEVEIVKDKVALLPYIFDMGPAYLVADVVISRAGASTLAEITLNGRPAILIPYPYSAYQHQKENAFYLKENGAAEVILEEELNKDKLFKTLLSLYFHPERLRMMMIRSKSLSNPRANKNVVKVMKEVVKML
ncbi:undecaprenyldiphospho-muramoylpentapeptide beta-N-acetylglucosaminyltransferase [bacterium]|nr:undecaprenyldiphospho-muramoylpentapeptide beta-N-acetylglucosaminyltransferase [bacterium]